MTSSPGVPVSTSSSAVPTTVAVSPSHVAAARVLPACAAVADASTSVPAREQGA